MRLVNLANLQQFAAINLTADPGAVGGPVVIPGAAKFILNWRLPDGKLGRNIIGMSVASGFDPTPALAEQGRAAIVSGANWAALAAFLAAGAHLESVALQDIRAPGLGEVFSTGASTPGTSSGTALPSEVAAVVTTRTARTGPGHRGRFYVPGWASNAVGAGDVIAAAAVTALGDWANANVVGAILAVGGAIALLLPARVSYTGSTGTVHPARAAGFELINALEVHDNHWDSQRRRGLR